MYSILEILIKVSKHHILILQLPVYLLGKERYIYIYTIHITKLRFNMDNNAHSKKQKLCNRCRSFFQPSLYPPTFITPPPPTTTIPSLSSYLQGYLSNAFDTLSDLIQVFILTIKCLLMQPLLGFDVIPPPWRRTFKPTRRTKSLVVTRSLPTVHIPFREPTFLYRLGGKRPIFLPRR